jgi:hypothetical protein
MGLWLLRGSKGRSSFVLQSFASLDGRGRPSPHRHIYFSDSYLPAAAFFTLLPRVIFAGSIGWRVSSLSSSAPFLTAEAQRSQRTTWPSLSAVWVVLLACLHIQAVN